MEKAFLASHLFTPSYFLFLFKNHLARLMKQNKEQRGGELFIGGRKFKLCWHCVTELNSYLRLFPQLWMGPKCHCYQCCTLKKTADNVAGRTGSRSSENVSRFHSPTLLCPCINLCHKSLFADKSNWYEPKPGCSSRETCHSLSARDCQPQLTTMLLAGTGRKGDGPPSLQASFPDSYFSSTRDQKRGLQPPQEAWAILLTSTPTPSRAPSTHAHTCSPMPHCQAGSAAEHFSLGSAWRLFWNIWYF